MPAPEEAFTITGGCNCGAVRYRVQVRKAVYPPRMLFHVPSVRPTDEKNILTATGICHCDSWRTGTGGIPASWGATPVLDSGVLSLDGEKTRPSFL
ncbi:hypothetical protein MCOR25_008719 [Pyricularia grisea]|nr:hypothetical protein MCOR25_008719 [Pyricularia grisea]